MKVKSVLRSDEWKFRIGRLMWTRGTVGDGNGYSCSLSLALFPRLLAWYKSRDEWCLIVAGIRWHFQRSWGGLFA